MDEETHAHVMPEKSRREYVKFARVIVAIIVFSALLTLVRGWSFRQFLNDFMAVFFITFAAFKFWQIETFVIAYRSYDLLSKKFRPWAYAFPFVEAFLGFAYLLSDHNTPLYIATVVITGLATVGVWQELNTKQRRPNRVQCACLGNIIKLPLSTVSLFEDVLMLVMALLMLIT